MSATDENQPAHDTDPEQPEQMLAVARVHLNAGRIQEGRALLRQLTEQHPELDTAWLQLLATDPPAEEEIAILEGMLLHHPEHRFAPALRARLEAHIEQQRVIGVLEQAAEERGPVVLPPQMRIGDYLVTEGWATPQQIDEAIKLQARLQKVGISERIGTVMLMLGYLEVGELAVALGAASAFGLGELGDYLIQARVLQPVEVAAALAHQAAIAADLDKKYLRELEAASRPPKLREVLGLQPRQPTPVHQRPPKLGEVLVQLGLLSPADVERHVRGAEMQRDAWLSD